MKQIVSLLILGFISLPTIGQNPNWNPDFDADNLVGTTDLLGLLSVFGFDWIDDQVVQVVDSLDNANLMMVTHLEWSNLLLVSYHMDYEIPDSVDILMLFDFDTDNDLILDGLYDGVNYLNSAEPTIRFHLPPAVSGKKLLIVFKDSGHVGARGMKTEFYQDGSRVWGNDDVTISGQFQVAFALGGHYFFSNP
jgi:hypothetical protein